jgi:hypothetical protein
MSTMREDFTRRTLRMFAGVLIWAAHFTAIYAFHTLACALRLSDASWGGAHGVTWFIAGVTVVAGAALVAVITAARRAGTDVFENWLTGTVGALALVAVAWQGFFTVFMVPACR